MPSYVVNGGSCEITENPGCAEAVKISPSRNPAVLIRLFRLVDIHVFGVNHLARRRGTRSWLGATLASLGGPCRASLRPARLSALVEHLGKFVRGTFEFLRGRLNLVENATGQRRFRRSQGFFYR